MTHDRAGGSVQALLDVLPDAAILVDGEGRIVHANAQVEALFGYALGELLNQPVEELMPERFRSQHVGHRQGYVRQPTKRVMGQRGVELWGRRKDGSEFPVDIAIGPIEAAGHGELVLAVIRDMSERKRIEEELRTLNTELKQRIANVGWLNQIVMDLEADILKLREQVRSLQAQLPKKTPPGLQERRDE